jgi:hypothetical protein
VFRTSNSPARSWLAVQCHQPQTSSSTPAERHEIPDLFEGVLGVTDTQPESVEVVGGGCRRRQRPRSTR